MGLAASPRTDPFLELLVLHGAPSLFFVDDPTYARTAREQAFIIEASDAGSLRFVPDWGEYLAPSASPSSGRGRTPNGIASTGPGRPPQLYPWTPGSSPSGSNPWCPCPSWRRTTRLWYTETRECAREWHLRSQDGAGLQLETWRDGGVPCLGSTRPLSVGISCWRRRIGRGTAPVPEKRVAFWPQIGFALMAMMN